MLKIAIIGTAGRGEDFNRLAPSDYSKMCTMVLEIIDSITKEPYLISGGAAWADHIAVTLFNKKIAQHLELHLPANWDTINTQFAEDRSNDAGRISNHYHKRFSSKVDINSLAELDLALDRAKTTFNTQGFFARNSEVAKAQAIIALTFGDGAKLKDGGTANTFGTYLKRTQKNVSFHVDLNKWMIHTPAIL